MINSRILPRNLFSFFFACLMYALLFGCTQPHPRKDHLQTLQGKWQGNTRAGQISISINGDSLTYYRDENFWFETTIALKPDSMPHQLYATIQTSSSGSKDKGVVVPAIYKVSGDTLLLATDGGDPEPPISFEDAESRYSLGKASSQK